MRRYIYLLLICVLSAFTQKANADDRWTIVLEGKRVNDIVHTGNGVMWVGSTNIYKYEDGIWTVYTTADFLEIFSGLKVIAFDGESVWVGGSKVMKYDGEKWLKMRDFDDANPYSIEDMAFSPSGDLWAGTLGGGLLKYDGETWARYMISDDIVENMFFSIAFDKDGVVWAGTMSRGLYRFDGDTWTIYTPDDGLASMQVNDILIDDDGIWCGTDSGLSFFSGSSWTTYTTADGVVHDYVKSLAFGVNGDLWVSAGFAAGTGFEVPCEYSTYGGISHFEHGVWTNYTEDDGLVRNSVSSIAVAPDGSVWCGTHCGCSIFTPDAVSVDETIPETFPLIINGNYPNPFNPETTLDFTISGETILNLTIRNMLGQNVRTLSSGRFIPGNYKVIWDATDDNGEPVSSGLYFGVYDTGSILKSHKITVVR